MHARTHPSNGGSSTEAPQVDLIGRCVRVCGRVHCGVLWSPGIMVMSEFVDTHSALAWCYWYAGVMHGCKPGSITALSDNHSSFCLDGPAGCHRIVRIRAKICMAVPVCSNYSNTGESSTQCMRVVMMDGLLVLALALALALALQRLT